MRIETMALADLHEAEYNPRQRLRPGDPEYAQLKASLAQFGQVLPLVWNERSGRLVGGHQRRKLLDELGEETAQVVVVDLDEHQEKALNIALNQGGEWDEQKLERLLIEFKDDALISVMGGEEQLSRVLARAMGRPAPAGGNRIFRFTVQFALTAAQRGHVRKALARAANMHSLDSQDESFVKVMEGWYANRAG